MQYDGTTTTSTPPNVVAFDPKKRARSLFETPKSTSGSSSSSGDGVLHGLASVLHEARFLFNRDTCNPPTTPLNAVPHPNILSTAPSTSPAKYSPSKLPAFLQYAADKLGVKDAMDYEYRLANKGFGPDILPHVNDAEIIACGITVGDAIRLKRGAANWWASPEAK